MAKRKIKTGISSSFAPSGVQYYVPGKKRPIAYSSKSTSDLIGILSEIFYSIKDVQRAIFYDPTAKDILQIYIDKGYGDTIASDFFRYDNDSCTLTWYNKPYALLLSNFPFANTIEELKQYIECRRTITGKRKWIIKPLLVQNLGIRRQRINHG